LPPATATTPDSVASCPQLRECGRAGAAAPPNSRVLARMNPFGIYRGNVQTSAAVQQQRPSGRRAAPLSEIDFFNRHNLYSDYGDARRVRTRMKPLGPIASRRTRSRLALLVSTVREAADQLAGDKSIEPSISVVTSFTPGPLRRASTRRPSSNEVCAG